MNLAIQKFKAYVKLVTIVGLAMFVALVVFKNRSHSVTIWCFKRYEDVNVLWLLVATSVVSIVGWRVAIATRHVFRDLRKAKDEEDRRRLLQMQDAQQKADAAKDPKTKTRQAPDKADGP